MGIRLLTTQRLMGEGMAETERRFKRLIQIILIAALSLVLLGSYCDLADCEGSREFAKSFRVPNAPSWTPDGSGIAYARSGVSGVVMVDTDGNNPRSLLEPYSGNCYGAAYDYSPAVSPDGSQIAFATLREGSKIYDRIEIATLVIDESDSFRRLTKNGAYDINPVWSPDGSSIAFLSNRQNPNPRPWRITASTP